MAKTAGTARDITNTKALLEQTLTGSRLLYAYTMFIAAPLPDVFKMMGDPASWAKDYNGKPLPRLALHWDGTPYKAGSTMTLSARRSDGTTSSVGAVPMELIYWERDAELTFRYLTGSHLIYRLVYEPAGDNRTEFTVNVLVDSRSPFHNTLRQRMYANRRRKASINDHLRVKNELEARAYGRNSD